MAKPGWAALGVFFAGGALNIFTAVGRPFAALRGDRFRGFIIMNVSGLKKI
jgi:hypothetical protein